jgi:hypothetical protein
MRLKKLAALIAALGVGLGIGSAGSAGAAAARDKAPEVDIGRLQIAPEAEQVESFSILARPHSWSVVDEDTVIVWATPRRPYLIELAFPSRDLRFAHVIGVTSVGSRVYAKFDSVKVEGFRYPIDSIYELTREEARSWQRTVREAREEARES